MLAMHTRKEQAKQISHVTLELKKKPNTRKKYLSTGKGAKQKERKYSCQAFQTGIVRSVKLKSVFCNTSCMYVYLLPPDRWPKRRCELCVSCAGDEPGWCWETIRCHRSCHSWNTTRFVRNTSSFLSYLNRFLFVQCVYIQAACEQSDPSQVKLFTKREMSWGSYLTFLSGIF